jgi:heterodisulfide reductase subunit A
MESKSVLIIGGGPAGIEAANALANQGVKVTLIEKSEEEGGNIRNWVKLFPDFSNAEDVRANFRNILKNENISFISNTEIKSLYRDGTNWIAKNGSDKAFKADAALLTTGFEVFDAKRKEELGYGIYDNVITSVDFEHSIFKLRW